MTATEEYIDFGVVGVLTVLGGTGAWPTKGHPCSGYLLEYKGFRLLIDPGYATFPALLGHCAADEVDAVLVSHGHPDHCADLNPLLRARALAELPPTALPVYALPGALDAVLALDSAAMLEPAYRLYPLEPPRAVGIGPFEVMPMLLPHHVPNAGLRIAAGHSVVAYTGDSGPSTRIRELATRADVFIAEATYADRIPLAEDVPYLSTARDAGGYAAAAGVKVLLLTHLWPDSDPAASIAAARAEFTGRIEVARPGLRVDLPGN